MLLSCIDLGTANCKVCAPISMIIKRIPLHCTSVRRDIIAYLSEDEINLIIREKGLEKYTENTITDKKSWKKNF